MSSDPLVLYEWRLRKSQDIARHVTELEEVLKTWEGMESRAEKGVSENQRHKDNDHRILIQKSNGKDDQ